MPTIVTSDAIRSESEYQTDSRWPTNGCPGAVSGTNDANRVEQSVHLGASALADRGAEIEALRRLPTDIVEQLRAWGVFRLLMPKALGGTEAPPALVFRVVEDLAWADASVGWCAMIGLGTNLLASLLPEQGAREIFERGDEITAGAVMPNGRAVVLPDGSYRVSGEWPFASGIKHCDWICGGSLVVDDEGRPRTNAAGAPDLRFAWVPAREVEVLDTWDVVGLQGTGSHDYRVQDALVPARRMLSLADCHAWWSGPLWRTVVSASGAASPFTLLFPLVAAVSIGIAHRAVDELITLATDKVPYRSTRPLRERGLAQASVARAEALSTSARCYFHQAANEIWDTVNRGEDVPMSQRARVRLATLHAGQVAAEAVRLCYQTAGGTALYRRHPLQRLFRDAHAATQHWILNPCGYETVGRVLFGLAADVPL